jgi:cytochrome c
MLGYTAAHLTFWRPGLSESDLPFLRIALLAGAAWLLPAARAADVAAGKLAFAKCASCHQVGRYAQAGYGPQLNGIIGRPAAATEFKYSDALKASRLVWTEQNLAAFLRSPDTLVPGNKMRFWGIRDEQQIANLLAYLRTLP